MQRFSRLKTQNNPQAVQPLIIEYQVETIETNQYHPELSILALYLRIGSLASPKNIYRKNIYDFTSLHRKETYTVNKQYQFRLDKQAFQKKIKNTHASCRKCSDASIIRYERLTSQRKTR